MQTLHRSDDFNILPISESTCTVCEMADFGPPGG